LKEARTVDEGGYITTRDAEDLGVDPRGCS
jgi:hypothetical protein